MPLGVEEGGVGVAVGRAELEGAVEPLVQRELIVVQQLADALGAAAGVVGDRLGEHPLLGVEVVVGEPRRHARGAIHGRSGGRGRARRSLCTGWGGPEPCARRSGGGRAAVDPRR